MSYTHTRTCVRAHTPTRTLCAWECLNGTCVRACSIYEQVVQTNGPTGCPTTHHTHPQM
eukprot:JP442004.1.p2 GENE.JP442004.1~~JP442004.1.p2  ORF type:complete len:59 (-),score=3.59 JP442004.1:38-214(-)